MPRGVVTRKMKLPAAHSASGRTVAWWMVPPRVLYDATVPGTNDVVDSLVASLDATVVPYGIGLRFTSYRRKRSCCALQLAPATPLMTSGSPSLASQSRQTPSLPHAWRTSVATEPLKTISSESRM